MLQGIRCLAMPIRSDTAAIIMTAKQGFITSAEEIMMHKSEDLSNADNAELLLATLASLTDKNLYAYCDNNPVMRKDEGGEFGRPRQNWHLIL